jgi:hypothetical protein
VNPFICISAGGVHCFQGQFNIDLLVNSFNTGSFRNIVIFKNLQGSAEEEVDTEKICRATSYRSQFLTLTGYHEAIAMLWLLEEKAYNEVLMRWEY